MGEPTNIGRPNLRPAMSHPTQRLRTSFVPSTRASGGLWMEECRTRQPWMTVMTMCLLRSCRKRQRLNALHLSALRRPASQWLRPAKRHPSIYLATISLPLRVPVRPSQPLARLRLQDKPSPRSQRRINRPTRCSALTFSAAPNPRLRVVRRVPPLHPARRAGCLVRT